MAQKRKTTKKKKQRSQDFVSFYDEVLAWLMIAVSIFIFLSNFGLCGTVGNTISVFFFGIFGIVQYIVPIVILVFSLLMIANKFNSLAIKKTIFGIILIYMASVFAQMIFDIDQSDFAQMYISGSEGKDRRRTAWRRPALFIKEEFRRCGSDHHYVRCFFSFTDTDHGAFVAAGSESVFPVGRRQKNEEEKRTNGNRRFQDEEETKAGEEGRRGKQHPFDAKEKTHRAGTSRSACVG